MKQYHGDGAVARLRAAAWDHSKDDLRVSSDPALVGADGLMVTAILHQRGRGSVVVASPILFALIPVSEIGQGRFVADPQWQEITNRLGMAGAEEAR